MHPDLLQEPHILKILVDLHLDEATPVPLIDPINHLLDCPYCRAALFIFSQARRDAEEMESYSQQACYAEAVVKYGTSEAGRRYPELVAHVEECASCRQSVAETIEFLREA